MRPPRWHQQLGAVGWQGTKQPNAFSFWFHTPLKPAQIHSLPRVKASLALSVFYRKYTHTTNQSDRAEQTGLIGGHHEPQVVPVGCVLWVEK